MISSSFSLLISFGRRNSDSVLRLMTSQFERGGRFGGALGRLEQMRGRRSLHREGTGAASPGSATMGAIVVRVLLLRDRFIFFPSQYNRDKI